MPPELGASMRGLSFSTTRALMLPLADICSKVRPVPAGSCVPQTRCISVRPASSGGRCPGSRSAAAPTSRMPTMLASCGRTKRASGASFPAVATAMFARAATVAFVAAAPKCGSAQTTETGPSAAARICVASARGSISASGTDGFSPAAIPFACSMAAARAATVAASRPGFGCTQTSAKSFSSPQRALTTTTRRLAADDGVLDAQGGDVVAGLEVVGDDEDRLRRGEARQVGREHLAAEGRPQALGGRARDRRRCWSRCCSCRRWRGRSCRAGSSLRSWRAASRGSRSRPAPCCSADLREAGGGELERLVPGGGVLAAVALDQRLAGGARSA